jgi:15-cis-phytoene synthase/lycopene beta-cyclase
LIRNKIWTYPPNVIVGPTLFDIPAEEVFFFVIQTYTTSLLYLILNKATFHPIYLHSERENEPPLNSSAGKWLFYRLSGQFVLVLGLSVAWILFNQGGTGTYMALIVGWAFPFLLFLWWV